MSTQNGYIQAVGDSDYNFGYNDFTVEFFVEPTSNTSNSQTLFEISNNESAAAELYQQTRFLTLIENGNLNAVALQTIAPFFVPGNTANFTSPIPVNSNYRMFYNGELLQSSQYNIVDDYHIALVNVPLNSSNTLVEVSEILFEVNGGTITSNTQHFISAERYQNNFYLYLDGLAQSSGVPAYQAIPTQLLPWSGNANVTLNRTGSPALLTIGANQSGQNPFYGEFGDFKITNGVARHVAFTQSENIITGSYTISSLGIPSAEITIDGSGSIDSFSSFSPEEQVTAQIFDTMQLSVYQSNLANANSTIIGYSIFKPEIFVGPISAININITGSSVDSFRVPWTSLGQSDASVYINGVPQPADGWSISDSNLIINYGLPSTGYIQVVATGPTSYHIIAGNAVTMLTSNVYANTAEITVANISNFITPSLGNYSNSSIPVNSRGQIFIDDECITYLYVNANSNTFSGLMRGANGTAVANFHAAGTQVISASYTQDLGFLTSSDPGEKVWYTTSGNIFTTHTSLQNTNSTISTILLDYGTVPPQTPV